MDIFERLSNQSGPLGKYKAVAEGKFVYPKFSGAVSNKIHFNNKEIISWSYNNYLGLANSPKIRIIDSYGQEKWGMTYPMGSRMMTGDTDLHDTFEKQFAELVEMESAVLLNFGYQGMLSIVDSLLSINDVVISDAQCHACSIDGIRLHKGKKLIFKHNDVEDLEQKLALATKLASKTNGGILVITEGVFSMSGEQGKLKEICDLKSKYSFRLLVDDAHGFGVKGEHGQGTMHATGTQHQVDLYFTTFTKSMVSYGAVVAGKKDIIDYFKYNLRSQIFSKSLQMPVVNGLIERLKLVKAANEERNQLHYITNLLQNGLKERNLLSDKVTSCITPVHLNLKMEEVFQKQNLLVSKHGIYCSIVVYPVIPKDQVIFRMTPTCLHTEEDVYKTLDAFDQVFLKQEAAVRC